MQIRILCRWGMDWTPQPGCTSDEAVKRNDLIISCADNYRDFGLVCYNGCAIARCARRDVGGNTDMEEKSD
jgi:hypothetical protein